MTIIKVSASVQLAPNIPATALSAAIEVEAYTKIEFVLTDQTPTKAFNLGTLGTDVLFVLIKSDLNDSDAAVKPELFYTAGGETKKFVLDTPHLYQGAGFVQSLGAAGIDFTNLTFTLTPLTTEQITEAQTNKQTIAKSVKVEILVGGPAHKPAVSDSSKVPTGT